MVDVPKQNRGDEQNNGFGARPPNLFGIVNGRRAEPTTEMFGNKTVVAHGPTDLF